MKYDCIVIGGGIVGTAAAYHLAGEGAHALLVDREDKGRATSAGAGILSPHTYRGDSEAWFRFANLSFQYLEDLAPALAATGAETGFDRCGAMVVAVDEEEVAPFAAARELIFARQRALTPSGEQLREISAAEASELFPPLAAVRGAIHNSLAARVDGRLLERALRSVAVARGLEMFAGSAERLILNEGTAVGAVVNGEEIEARAVIVCGGAWSRSFSTQLDIDIPVVPQRGQIIHLEVDDHSTGSWPVVSAFHDHYMVPWPDGRVAVGATRETGAGFEPRTTAAGIHEVLAEAMRVAPGLASAAIADIRVGLRPLSRDTFPVIGAVPGVAGLFLATGHGASGLQLGPYSGRIAADLALGRELPSEARPFRVDRFL
jgi:D-amino-acid dehydrogenase